MRPVTIIMIAVGAIAALETAAQEEQPVASVMAAVRQHFTQECRVARERVASSTQPFDRALAGVVVRMNCDCLPGEAERIASDLGGGKEGATTTQGAFLARMKIAVNACTARILRADIRTRCESADESMPDVRDRKAYCGCLSAKLDTLDDDTIATAAAISNKNFQDQVQAKVKGLSAPASTPTVLDGIEQACKQPAG